MRIYFATLKLLCSMSLISTNFDIKSIIFSQYWPGVLEKALQYMYLQEMIMLCSKILRSYKSFHFSAKILNLGTMENSKQ